jgi:KDO2-lipid IV(A) lauroyltransferase
VVTSPGLVRAAIRLMGVIPVPLARVMAWVAGTIAWAAMGNRRRALHETLAYTAPGRSPAEHRRLARRTFRNMAGCAVDMFRMPTAGPGELIELFEIHNIEHLHAAQALGKGTVIVTGHIGPYELAGGSVASAGYPMHAMVEDLDPEVLDALKSYRASTGMGIVNMRDGLRAAYRILRRGEILILVADRAVGDTRGAIEVPFAGGIRRFPTGPAIFSMTTGAPILIGFVSLNPDGKKRYRIDFDPPMLPEGRDDAERDRLTRHIACRIGQFVTDHPDQWFVFQPQWITRAA